MKDILDAHGRWLGRRWKRTAQQGNLAPIAVDDSLTVPRTAGPTVVTVLANDVDPEGQPLSLISAYAALGTAVANGDGTVTYTPPGSTPPGVVEYDTVVYEIADDQDQRDTGQINVTIGGDDLQINITGENTLAIIADTGPIDITVTEPAAFAGSYQADVADLAAGPLNLVLPSISGTPEAGQVLTANEGLWISDTSAEPVTQSWQWQRGGADIAGETNATYLMLAGDEAAGIAVVETLTDANSARSAASASVPVAFTPAADSSLIGWWDASDAGTITETGGAVSSWADKAGGAALTQGVASRQPLTGGRSLNGLNVLDFDGGDYLERALTLPASGNLAIHMALGVDSVSNAFEAILALEATNDFQIDANDDAAFDGRLNATGIGPGTSLTGGPFSGAMSVSILFDFDASTSSVLVNGQTRGTMAYTTTIDISAALHVMTNRSKNASINGFVGELLMTGDLSSQGDYLAYLTQKWGLPNA